MTAAAAAGQSGLRAVKVKHTVICLVYKAVCRPCAVILLAELEPYKVGAALGAGKYVHITLVTLIDPTLSLKLFSAFGTYGLGKLKVCKGIGFAYIAGEGNMLYRFCLGSIGRGLF